MRAPHAPPPPLPSRIRKTISAYECLVIVCVCVCVRERERERERERWLCLDVDFHTARQQPKIVTPVFQKQNHAQRSSSPLERSLLSDTLHCACAPSSVCEGFFSLLLLYIDDRYFPVLYRYIRTVWVLSFTSLPSIPLLRQQGADGARYEYDIRIFEFRSFMLGGSFNDQIIKHYDDLLGRCLLFYEYAGKLWVMHC